MQVDEGSRGSPASSQAGVSQVDPPFSLQWIINNGEEFRAYEALKRGDHQTAVRLLEPLAEQGSLYALLTLGHIYEWGELGKPDFKSAIALYRRAAFSGSSEAYRRLGHLYLEQGDHDLAHFSFGQGAQAGNASCMYWLGHMAAKNGNPEGLAWLEKAADEGHFHAKRNV